MTVLDYLSGEILIILLVSVPCLTMYVLALLMVKIADHFSVPPREVKRNGK
jgi:hypothetical protein